MGGGTADDKVCWCVGVSGCVLVSGCAGVWVVSGFVCVLESQVAVTCIVCVR